MEAGMEAGRAAGTVAGMAASKQAGEFLNQLSFMLTIIYDPEMFELLS